MMAHDPLPASIRRCIVHYQQAINTQILTTDGSDDLVDRLHAVKIYDTDRYIG
jgi:hypothetical protein